MLTVHPLSIYHAPTDDSRREPAHQPLARASSTLDAPIKNHARTYLHLCAALWQTRYTCDEYLCTYLRGDAARLSQPGGEPDVALLNSRLTLQSIGSRTMPHVLSSITRRMAAPCACTRSLFQQLRAVYQPCNPRPMKQAEPLMTAQHQPSMPLHESGCSPLATPSHQPYSIIIWVSPPVSPTYRTTCSPLGPPYQVQHACVHTSRGVGVLGTSCKCAVRS